MAPANLLICNGLATTNGKLALEQAKINACSNLPVASIIIRWGECFFISVKASLIPFSSLETEKKISKGGYKYPIDIYRYRHRH